MYLNLSFNNIKIFICIFPDEGFWALMSFTLEHDGIAASAVSTEDFPFWVQVVLVLWPRAESIHWTDCFSFKSLLIIEKPKFFCEY